MASTSPAAELTVSVLTRGAVSPTETTVSLASRLRPGTNTEVASPTSGPVASSESAASCIVLPLTAGKSVTE